MKQPDLRLKLAGAAHHVTGEAVWLQVVNPKRLLVRELVSTVAAAKSFQLRVCHSIVPPSDVLVQLWLRNVSSTTALVHATEEVIHHFMSLALYSSLNSKKLENVDA